MTYNKSAVCKAANALVKRGYTRSAAFRSAWKLAKNITAKVAGVSFGRRPAALERLTRYAPEQISIRLEREENNPHDGSAISIMAAVEGKGAYCVGFVPAAISKALAAIIDKGVEVKAAFGSIVGGYCEGMNYGMRIALAI